MTKQCVLDNIWTVYVYCVLVHAQLHAVPAWKLIHLLYLSALHMYKEGNPLLLTPYFTQTVCWHF